ncbi:Lpg1974 family pore-forming outer membrane protein [Estrella lausannensis]|uniref:Outer membrane protein n=1 Tax=Estrella lausannensis TaxID=483423 RepID=A0A0H5DSB1_9BACT|nr:Lpg1974 family pore-forming outer membrane protein [Estrella lausannensis]CRX38634.1 Outer membrane protein [Estrella lausannensis]
MGAKTRFFTLLAGVQAFFPTNGYSYDNDACSFDRASFYRGDCFCAEIAVDALYLKPCLNEDSPFVAKVTGSSSGESSSQKVKYQFVCPEWEFGVRGTVALPKAYRTFDFSASYTWIEFKTDAKEDLGTDANLAATRVHPFVVGESGVQFFNAAEADLSGKYQALDLIFSYSCPFAICHSISPFAGVQCVSYRQAMDTTYLGQLGGSARTVEADWKSRFQGAGLIAGTDYRYALCEGFSLIARASGSLLAGEFSVKDKQIVTIENNSGINQSTLYRFDDDKCCRIVPGWDVRVGAAYEVDLCGCELSLRAGYEVIGLCNLATQRGYFSELEDGNIAGSDKTEKGLLVMHGAFAGFDVKF